MSIQITDIKYRKDSELGYEVFSGDVVVARLTQENYYYCCESYGCNIYNGDDKLHSGGNGRSIPEQINTKSVIYKPIDSPGVDSYIGATVKSVHWHRGRAKWSTRNDIDDKYDDAILNIDTDRGTLQLVVWTRHNGYYSHKYTAYFDGKEQEVYER